MGTVTRTHPQRIPAQVEPTPETARNLLLLRASEALSTTVTIKDIVDAVRHLGEAAPGAGSAYVHLDPDHSDPLTERAVVERRALYLANGAEFAAEFPTVTPPEAQAVACVPLVGETDVLGALHLLWEEPRTFSVADRAVITTLAGYITRALERARLFGARAGVADILQEAILSRTPTLEQYEVATCYIPAAPREKVGGDWYDAVTGHDGRLTMVIGDVVGNDMVAAARMGQLRSMLRAFMVDRREPPSALLCRLDAAIHALGEPIMATAVVAVIEALSDGHHRLHWSNAGHPSPLVIHSDGTIQPLTGEDLMLGVGHRAPRQTSRVPLPPGSTMLLHTDGLVKRLGRVDEAGLADLHRRLRKARHTRLEDLLEDAVAHIGPEPSDDIAMLAVRLRLPVDR